MVFKVTVKGCDLIVIKKQGVVTKLDSKSVEGRERIGNIF